MAESGAGAVKRAGTGRQASQTAPAPARHQRARCAGAAGGQGAAAASGGRAGVGTRGHATMDPLRDAWLLFVAPPADNIPSVENITRLHQFLQILTQGLYDIASSILFT